MKGIAHFISGVTVASFCPWAIIAAQEGNPAYFILGAVAGILPDTIDFKFYRFFYPHDIRVEPQKSGDASQTFANVVPFDPEQLDPQPIADAIAQSVSAALDGKPITLKLSTIQISADNWRQYRVRIDPEAGDVRVQFGPIVSTGQVPQPNTLPEPRPVGVAKIPAPIIQSYEPTYTVDIFDGPSFKFTRKMACNKKPLADPDDDYGDRNTSTVEIDFLPWHRNWSHSLTIAATLAGIAAIWTWQASAVIFGAYVIHILEDQTGYMGSNLFFPFSKKRTPGLKWMHSGDALPNFFAVFLCCLLIFWNIYKAIPNPLYQFSFVRLLMTALVTPFVIFGAARWLLLRIDGEETEANSTEWNI